MSARHTIGRWVEAVDAEGISALYDEDAVNHQIALYPVVGRSTPDMHDR